MGTILQQETLTWMSPLTSYRLGLANTITIVDIRNVQTYKNFYGLFEPN